MSDGRRRRYVPVDVHLIAKPVGVAIMRDFGWEGIGVYVALLATAKKAPVEGTFEWVNDTSACAELGGNGGRPPFPFGELVALLGRHKVTSTRRRGELKQTTFTRWEQWNETIDRAFAADRMSRKRGENTRNDDRTVGERKANDSGTEEKRSRDISLVRTKPRARAREDDNPSEAVAPNGFYGPGRPDGTPSNPWTEDYPDPATLTSPPPGSDPFGRPS